MSDQVTAALPVDLLVVGIANLMNLLLIGMFLARGFGRPRTGRTFGTGVVVLAVPLAAAALWNAGTGRPWWTVALPAVMVAYCVVEFLLDYIYRVDFRHSRWLGPYLGLYYAGLIALIGYAFLVDNLLGYVTLVPYFAGLAATWYSYAHAGHG